MKIVHICYNFHLDKDLSRSRMKASVCSRTERPVKTMIALFLYEITRRRSSFIERLLDN